MTDLPIVVAMTGASGSAYGRRLVEILLRAGREVHFSMSPSADQVLLQELGMTVDRKRADLGLFRDAPTEKLKVWHHLDLSAGIASGSFRTAGMAIVPCSMSTLAAIATGQTTNLIQRAADVHLKERRKLILTPRETPLSLIALENMTQVTRAGAVVLPAMPGLYHNPTSIDDLIDFIVSRICDQLGLDNNLITRWGRVATRD
jgi:4-hydroxy-3-polyprenylbenzoate decarboxylase